MLLQRRSGPATFRGRRGARPGCRLAGATVLTGPPMTGRRSLERPPGPGGHAAMHSSLIGKVEKANRYARELDRITIDRMSLTFRGDNDTHHVDLDAGQWRCTCP